jgi:hypothetical protein
MEFEYEAHSRQFILYNFATGDSIKIVQSSKIFVFETRYAQDSYFERTLADKGCVKLSCFPTNGLLFPKWSVQIIDPNIANLATR